MLARRFLGHMLLIAILIGYLLSVNIPTLGQASGDAKGAPSQVAQTGFVPAKPRGTDDLEADKDTMQWALTDVALRTFSLPSYAGRPFAGNFVAEWNATAQEIVQPTMSGMQMPGISMANAFVYLAYVQGAVYDALVAIEGGYRPYALHTMVDPSASREAAVAMAAYTVLAHYVPSTMLDTQYATSLGTIPDSAAKTAGIAIGEHAAAAMLALRAGDVLSGSGGYTVPTPGQGIWEPTMLMPDGVTPAPPVDPWMAVLTPFLRTAPDQYCPAPPPVLTSAEYMADLNEVKAIGGSMSATRTAEQTEVATFWVTNMVIQCNSAYRQLAESRGLSLIETARLMALGNMLATDGLIATFDAKYHYSFWRPVTAIRHTNPDGSYSATPLNTWMPAVMTPNFPEYVAGHGAFVSAQAELYTRFFGPQIEIDLQSGATGTTRHYATAEDLRTEIVNARTWGGLHFRNSTMLSVDLGQQLAADALANFLQPVSPVVVPLLLK